MGPIEVDVHNITDIKCQQVIRKPLALKYTEEGSLDGTARLHKTEESLNTELMGKKVC